MKPVLMAAVGSCLVFWAGGADASFYTPVVTGPAGWIASVTDASTRASDEEDPFAALEHGLRPNVLAPGKGAPGWSLAERMRYYNVPGVAVAVVRNGEVMRAAGFGVREAGTQDRVDGDTLFSTEPKRAAAAD